MAGERCAGHGVEPTVVLAPALVANVLRRALTTMANGTATVPVLGSQAGAGQGGPALAWRTPVTQVTPPPLIQVAETIVVPRAAASTSIVSIRRARTWDVPVPVGDTPTCACGVPAFPSIHYRMRHFPFPFHRRAFAAVDAQAFAHKPWWLAGADRHKASLAVYQRVQ